MSVSTADRSSHPHRQVDTRESAGFKVFALAVILLNGLLLVLAASQASTTLPNQLPEVLAWTVLVAGAGLVPLSSGKGPSLAMDLPLLLAAAFIFGPLASGLIALLGAVDIREFRREVSWSRALWNRSQTSISVMCASCHFLAFWRVGRLAHHTASGAPRPCG